MRAVTNAICGFWDHKGRPGPTPTPLRAPGRRRLQLPVEGVRERSRPCRRSAVMAQTESTALEASTAGASSRSFRTSSRLRLDGLRLPRRVGARRAYVEGQEPGGVRRPWPWHLSGSGDIDILGDRKPQSYLREALWRAGILHLAVPPAARRRVEGEGHLLGLADVESIGPGRGRKARR